LSVSPETLPLFLLAGGIAGFLNTVAGGGSLFTFPLLVLLGFPAQVANGTIRISILMQNLVAVPTYARHGFFLPGPALALAAVAIPAAVLGANAAVRLDPDPFRKLAAILLVAVLATMFVSPSSWMRETSRDRIRWRAVLPWMAAVGFYGGFFQVGAGVPFLAAAVLAGGWDLVTANALKVTVILLYTAVALAVFAAHDQVDWLVGFSLGLGNMGGAWLGARAAVRKGPTWIRWILAAMALVAAGKMFFEAARG
jgi:uncharacterized membrane protein YfcA